MNKGKRNRRRKRQGRNPYADLNLDFDTNVALFNARLERPLKGLKATGIVGEDFNGEFRERDAILAYHQGEVPHLDFTNLSPDTPSQGANEALRFISRWAPLKKSHFMKPKTETVVHEVKGYGKIPQRVLIEQKFRVPLDDFWREQKRFKDLVSVLCGLSEGKGEYKKARQAVGTINAVVSQVHPIVEVSEKERAVVGLMGSPDLLSQLYFCLWSDIAGRRPIRRCKNEFCQRFFHPSRERQLYHNQVCLRRQLQREYMRAKRSKARRVRSRKRR